MATQQHTWETTLERLELDVLLLERFLADPTRPLPEPWAVPSIGEPLPDGLRARAEQVRERQERAREAVSAVMSTVTRQRHYAATVDRAVRLAPPPVYLDLHA